MGKQEISWKLRREDGTKREVLARRFGSRWRFMERDRRYDPWRDIAEPSREDWETLLDGLRRRYPRKGYIEEDIQAVESEIAERFPNEAAAPRSESIPALLPRGPGHQFVFYG
jgi:hypothetical protein